MRKRLAVHFGKSFPGMRGSGKFPTTRFICFYINDTAQACSGHLMHKPSKVTQGVVFEGKKTKTKNRHPVEDFTLLRVLQPFASKSAPHHNTASAHFGSTSSQLSAAAASLKACSLFRAAETQCPGINGFACPG